VYADLILWRGKSRLLSSAFIIFALLCSYTAVASPSWLLPSSRSITTSPSRFALYTDSNALGHINWTPTPTEGGDIQLMMSFPEWSTAVMVLAAVVVIAGVVNYRRRDPIIIDDESFD
jgi:hypothetical protein